MLGSAAAQRSGFPSMWHTAEGPETLVTCNLPRCEDVEDLLLFSLPSFPVDDHQEVPYSMPTCQVLSVQIRAQES